MAENPDKWPFKEIVRCNIGNPQALGQAPPAFARAVLSQVVLPAKSKGSKQVKERADAYRAALRGGVGAYSDSQGVALVREEVAKFISDRDGYDASPADIFLTDGASAGVRHFTQLLVSGPQDGVLAPAPQYPCTQPPRRYLMARWDRYYLDEAADWAAPVQELKKAYDDVVAKGATPKLLVIINPGKSDGASLPRKPPRSHRALRGKAARVRVGCGRGLPGERLRRRAAVHQFKKIVRDLNSKILVSFHSISKGFTGECGLRGGYFELTNIDTVRESATDEIASVSLLEHDGPGRGRPDGQPAHVRSRAQGLREGEEGEISLRRAPREQGGRCFRCSGGRFVRPPAGRHVFFPSITLPDAAVKAAKRSSMAPDAFYALRLLEGTGLVTVPGSGFGQKNGTWHFRTTFYRLRSRSTT